MTTNVLMKMLLPYVVYPVIDCIVVLLLLDLLTKKVVLKWLINNYHVEVSGHITRCAQ